MAQVIQTLCDVHLHAEDEKQLIGRTFIVNVNGRARAVELCAMCEEALLVPLQAVLNEHGRKVNPSDMPPAVREPRADTDKTETCPLDGRVFKSRAGLAIHARMHEMSVEALLGETPNLGLMMCTFPDCGHRSVSRAAIGTHVLNRHGMTLSEVETQYSAVHASLDVHNKTPSHQLTCPVCGGGPFKTRAGLGTHADKVHDMTVSMLLDEPDRVKCPHCTREYENEHAMLDHTRKHEESRNICLDCSPAQKFTTKAGMISHRRSKHKDKVAA